MDGWMAVKQDMPIMHMLAKHPRSGVVGCGEGVVYLTSPGHPTEIGLQKICDTGFYSLI